jgi:hypothetical protein
VQIGFDQIIFSDPAEKAWLLPGLPGDLDEALASYLPRDVSPLAGGPGGVPKNNRLSVKLTKVREDSIIAVWMSGAYLSADAAPLAATTSLAVEDEAGAAAFVGFATQRSALVAGATGSGTVIPFSLQSLGPNPTGKEEDFVIYPTAWTDNNDIIAAPEFNQVAIIAAEIAQS